MVIDIDASADKKWQCISAMPSQFGDKDSWQGRTRPDVPKTDAERPAYLLNLAKQRIGGGGRSVSRQARGDLRRGARPQGQVRRGVSAWPVRPAGVGRRTEGVVPVERRVPGAESSMCSGHGFTGSRVRQVHGFAGLHCSRSASVGLMRVARRAGSQQAMAATANSATHVADSVVTSRAATP